MTTIIERPSGGSDGGTVALALIVGAIAAAAVAMFAFGTFDPKPTETNLTIEMPPAAMARTAPTAPTASTAPTAPQAAPAEPEPAPPQE